MEALHIPNETPIWQLTVGQFLSLMNYQKPSEEKEKKSSDRRYVKGLAGIQSIFGCSNPTAQKLKRTIIKEAVTQNGRVILTDVERALQLFREYQEKHGILSRIPDE